MFVLKKRFAVYPSFDTNDFAHYLVSNDGLSKMPKDARYMFVQLIQHEDGLAAKLAAHI